MTDILDRLYTRFDPRIVQPDELAREAYNEILKLRKALMTISTVANKSINPRKELKK